MRFRLFRHFRSFAVLSFAASALSGAVFCEDPLSGALTPSGVPAGWQAYPGPAGHPKRTGEISTQPVDGRSMLALKDTGDGEIGVFRSFPVKPGEYLKASVQAMLPPGAEARTDYTFVLQLSFPKHRQTFGRKLVPEVGKCREYAVAARVPAGATEARVHLYSHYAPRGTVLFRDFRLEKSDRPFVLPAEAGTGAQTLEAEAAALNPERAEAVEQAGFSGGRGVSLKPEVKSCVRSDDAADGPDLVFNVRVPAAGRYVLRTHAATDAAGTAEMAKASSKFASMYLKLQIGDRRPTRRVVFVPWSRPESCVQTSGVFEFAAGEQPLKLWLPAGMRLDWISLTPYRPPAVPPAARDYRPELVPPAGRPRLWVNAESLPEVRANLTRGENLPLWNQVVKDAKKPFAFKVSGDGEIPFDPALEKAAATKAFYYLMTGDEAIGREAVRLTEDYLARVEFGNLLDITREIGAAIYSAARVYDWCYGLMTPEQRDGIRRNLMRLADDMECGWPPFKQTIVNGHGNEAQINRDLLSMAIAIYDEDPVPYRYCAYAVLEQLVPMRRFEYRSPRHNQGIGYGAYRFGWEMHAAWLFRRMLGRPVFDDNLKDVRQYWLQMRLPSGEMLRDGDGIPGGRYWGAPMTALLCYSYAADPVLKAEFLRQGGLPYDPLLVLLLNDPALRPEPDLNVLPQTFCFGPVRGGMVARTGWNIGRLSNDAVAEIKGGGFHFGNHQRSDSGAFQIYYRGLLAAPLGQYKFYGTPYDFNFAKRSISHSMMLVVDPAERFLSTPANDGGTRFNQSCPTSPEQAAGDPRFRNGEVISYSFGPSEKRPCFSYFAANLASAYTAKVRDYVRRFCFLNFGDPERPAAILMYDDLTVSDPKFRKYWQITTLNPPERTPSGVRLTSSAGGLTGKLDLQMFRPSPEARTVEILSGEDADSVFGQKYTPPSKTPEARAHRVMFSPKRSAEREEFFTVMQIYGGGREPLPVEVRENDAVIVAALADRVVAMARGTAPLDRAFTVEAPADGGDRQILLAGLKAGVWSVTPAAGTAFNVEVKAGGNTAFFTGSAARYRVAPGAAAGAPLRTPDRTLEAPRTVMPEHAVIVDGAALPGAVTRREGDELLVPAAELLPKLGAEIRPSGAGSLAFAVSGGTAVFRDGSAEFTLDGRPFGAGAPARLRDGVWYLPAPALAALTGWRAVRESAGDSILFLPAAGRLPTKFFWAEANTNPDPEALFALLSGSLGTQYWAANGRDTVLKIVLKQPTELDGVAIKWLDGPHRTAKFALEVSSDGEHWERVFDGASRGTDGEEEYRFARKRVSQVRFLGFGNSRNEWNSLYSFRLLEP